MANSVEDFAWELRDQHLPGVSREALFYQYANKPDGTFTCIVHYKQLNLPLFAVGFKLEGNDAKILAMIDSPNITKALEYEKSCACAD